MDISKRIASIREAKGFTQKQIADLFDMEQSNYSRLEKRGNKLTIEQLEMIAGALGVSVIELLTGEPLKEGDDERVKGLNERIEELQRYLKYATQLNESLEETNLSQEKWIDSTKKILDEYVESDLVQIENLIHEAFHDSNTSPEELYKLLKTLIDSMGDQMKFISINLGISLGINEVADLVHFYQGKKEPFLGSGGKGV